MTPSSLPDAPGAAPRAGGLRVLYEDARLIAVDKPSGLLSQPGRTVHDSVSVRLVAARPDAARVALVHRLDMDTSGVLLLAKDADAHRRLSAQFERRTVAKRYRALLERRPGAAGGLIDLALRTDLDDRPRQIVDPAQGRPSVTAWFRRVQDIVPGDPVATGATGATEVVLLPRTGRSHQLRVHVADPRGLGIPVAGDRLYGAPGARLYLHAERLAFDHPGDGRRVVVTAPPPFGIDGPADDAVDSAVDGPGPHG